MSSKPNVIALEGNPFDGAILPIDPVPHEMKEIVFHVSRDYGLEVGRIIKVYSCANSGSIAPRRATTSGCSATEGSSASISFHTL